MTEILTALGPGITDHLVEIAVALLLALAGIAVRAFTRWTGIQIDAGRRAALHEALRSGVRAALEAAISAPDGPKARELIAATAIEKARLSVPEAIAHFAPPEEVLRNIARRYVNEALEAGS